MDQGEAAIEHQYWQHRVVQLFESTGWTTKRELGDADISVNMQETGLVVEIAMGDNERERDHLRQHPEARFDLDWVVCRDTAVRDGIMEQLAEHDLLDWPW